MSAGQVALVCVTALGLLCWLFARTCFACGVVVGYAHGRLSREMGVPAATVLMTAMAQGVDVRAVPLQGETRVRLGAKVGVWVARLAMRRLVRVCGEEGVTQLLGQIASGRVVIMTRDDELPPPPPGE